MKKLFLSFSVISLILVSCIQNPVTGKKQFTLVSPEQEVALGTQNYLPSQQSQGGQYTVDPALTDYVQSVGRKLAAVSDRPNLPYEFVVLNNDVPNAWALPGGKLAINRGLLFYLEDEAQLAAVLGHEIVHAAARHGAQQQTSGLLMNAGVLIAGVAVEQNRPEYSGVALGAIGLGANAWSSKYSREHELEADAFGIKYMVKAGYDARAAVELQEIFVKMQEGKNPDFISGLFASHPPSQERVAKNRAAANKYPGGLRNKAQFEKAMSKLNRDKPAYENYQKAQEAFNTKKVPEAMAYIEKSIQQEPKENLFWEMKGQLLLQQKKPEEATAALNRAAQLNPQYFKSYVLRGLSYHQQAKGDLAEKDFAYSMELLPTQIASYYLGEINLAKGNRQAASQYFQQAAQGGGEIGEAAKAQLGNMQ